MKVKGEVQKHLKVLNEDKFKKKKKDKTVSLMSVNNFLYNRFLNSKGQKSMLTAAEHEARLVLRAILLWWRFETSGTLHFSGWSTCSNRLSIDKVHCWTCSLMQTGTRIHGDKYTLTFYVRSQIKFLISSYIVMLSDRRNLHLEGFGWGPITSCSEGIRSQIEHLTGLGDIMVRASTLSPERMVVRILAESYQRLQKWYMLLPCLMLRI